MDSIEVIRSEMHYHEKEDNYAAYYHFSSGFHIYPKNNNFGFLRQFNEYTIPPKSGSEFLFNDNIEIVGIILDGELKYKDNQGNDELINPQEYYKISAGTGIIYSEINNSETDGLRLLEIWVFPTSKGMRPSFIKGKISADIHPNTLLAICSTQGTQDVDPESPINKGTTFYVCRLTSGQKISYNLDKGRGGYSFLINGNISLENNVIMNKGDAAKISSPQDSLQSFCLSIDNSFTDPANLILIDLPMTR